MDATGIDVVTRLLPSLALIVGLLLLVRRWAQRSARSNGAGITVLARAGLTKGAMVAVVEINDRRYLVGASEHGVSLLSELDDGEETAESLIGALGATATTSEGHAAGASPAGLDNAELDLEAATAAAAPTAGRKVRAGGGLAHAHQLFSTAKDAPSASTPRDRPRMGPIDRLRHMTVRTHLERPIRAPRA